MQQTYSLCIQIFTLKKWKLFTLCYPYKRVYKGKRRPTYEKRLHNERAPDFSIMNKHFPHFFFSTFSFVQMTSIYDLNFSFCITNRTGAEIMLKSIKNSHTQTHAERTQNYAAHYRWNTHAHKRLDRNLVRRPNSRPQRIV